MEATASLTDPSALRPFGPSADCDSGRGVHRLVAGGADHPGSAADLRPQWHRGCPDLHGQGVVSQFLACCLVFAFLVLLMFSGGGVQTNIFVSAIRRFVEEWFLVLARARSGVFGFSGSLGGRSGKAKGSPFEAPNGVYVVWRW